MTPTTLGCIVSDRAFGNCFQTADLQMTVTVAIPTTILFKIAFDQSKEFVEWAIEGNHHRPKLPQTIDLHASHTEVTFPDEASATIFKLRWL